MHKPHLVILQECETHIKWKSSTKHENLMLLWDKERINCDISFRYHKENARGIDKYISANIQLVKYPSVKFKFHGVYGDLTYGLDLEPLKLTPHPESRKNYMIHHDL